MKITWLDKKERPFLIIGMCGLGSAILLAGLNIGFGKRVNYLQ